MLANCAQSRPRAGTATRDVLQRQAPHDKLGAMPSSPEAGSDPAERAVSTDTHDPQAMLLQLRVNGEAVAVAARPHHTLLEVLRYQLDLIGSKQGCDKGDCGACTVQIDGAPALACLTLAAVAQGREVETVEGLGRAHGGCHPLQDAFDRWDAAQCGFCTPGILMSADALLRKQRGPVSPAQVREALAGNLCRCTGYTKIIDAVVDASAELHGVGRDDDAEAAASKQEAAQ